jgi:thiol:disulfide interchange protein DsbD
MALTLTITSFTCTAPLDAGLLVMASKGSYFYPELGLVIFATFLALPFFVLALFPSLMKTMPRSGDWMNSVKVVGGLLEIGAAFKFLNTAEVSFARGDISSVWIDAEVLLSIWVVLSFVCGIYLLGLFRTNHDHDVVSVGPGRMLTGSLFLVIALFLTPALFGNPPRSNFYDLIAGILPPDAGELERGGYSTGGASPTQIVDAGSTPLLPPQAQKATSTDPEEAIRQERTVHGVSWGLSYDAAIEEAKKSNRPVLIDFTGVNCANCRTMERKIMPRPEVIAEMQRFVTVQLYTDFVPISSLTQDDREDLALENLAHEQDLTGQTTSPLYAVLDPDGKVLGITAFDPNPAKFVQFLQDSLAKFQSGAKVAASD